MERSRRRLTVLAFVFMWMLIAAPAGAQPSGYEGYQVVRIDAKGEAEVAAIRALQALGSDFEVWSEVLRPGEIEARVAPAAREALAASGLSYRVTVHDLQGHLDELFGGDRDDPFFDSLRTLDEHFTFMMNLSVQYPQLAQVHSIGTSVQGRHMYALRITKGGGTKPGVFIHGAEHGNEAAGSSVVQYLAYHLLTEYDVDPAVTELVDNVEWWLLPIMNPDGYVAFTRYNYNGVDLNRNWGGPGSGENPWGGPYPFSEPETTALRDFLIARPTVRAHMDVHGYVPWIMWAWAHIPDFCPDHDLFETIGVEMRQRISDAGGGWYEIGTIYDVAYYVSGCSTNYTYGVLDLWSMAVEVIDADMPDICEEYLMSMRYLGEWLWSYDCNANGIADAEDIASGTSEDVNDNGIPDECENFCPADVNDDNTVDVLDLLAVLAAWGETGVPEDVNEDGIVDILDLLAVLAAWGPCG